MAAYGASPLLTEGAPPFGKSRAMMMSAPTSANPRSGVGSPRYEIAKKELDP